MAIKNKISELTIEDEEVLEKNLVWIFGSARSGTTWLADQLLSFNTKIINEPHITEFLDMSAHHKHPEISRSYDEFKKNPNYFFSDEYKNTWNYYLRKLILNRFHVEARDLSKRIIVKEPGGLGASDIISKCLPNCKMIIMIRDPRDIIDSIWDGTQKNGFMSKLTAVTPKHKKDRINFIRGQSRWWIKLMENLLETYKKQSRNKVIQVRYEEIRNNTFDILKRIYQFLEIEIKDETIEEIICKYSFKNIPSSQKGSGKFFRSASPGKWKENFSDDEKNIMNEIMSNTLKKLGYTI
ncbi:MAG TPA: sulfotransferase domain-containing protein [Candidatus Paceibacterota bacterium]|nr:sulfotransferase domain-containing protein [Candidatus Paceibacterota bacterium]